MTKVSAYLPCLNDRKFIKETIDGILPYVDTLDIFQGNMPFTEFFTTGEGNSTDGTKEFIEEYIKDKPKITFHHSMHYLGGFDEMKPFCFKTVAEKYNPGYIWEVLANEMYLEKDLIELRRRMDNNEMPDVATFEFRHFYKLLRWSFKMGAESRVFKYNSGRYMPNQSYVHEANGEKIPFTPISGIDVYHFCPCKPIQSYIDKYICYSMRGRNAKRPQKQDYDWAIKVLTDEGYLLPHDMIQQEMERVGGGWMAKEYYGPWPTKIYEHFNFKQEVTSYYTAKGFKLENGIFVK